jgi:hypothetical protein
MAGGDCGGCVSTARMVLTWINWISLTIISGFVAYDTIDTDMHNYSKILLSVYFVVFGVVGILFEAKIEAVQKNVNFLKSFTGRGFTFFFMGTLGMSFGKFAEGVENWLPLLMGIFSIFVAIWNWITLCCGASDEDGSKYVEADGNGRGNATRSSQNEI